MNLEEKKQISHNAAFCYMLLLISWAFLLKKENHELIKNHAKSSTILHLFLVIIYFVFVYFGFLDIFQIFGICLNIIIANLLFIAILGFMIFGIFKALDFEKLSIGEVIKIKNKSVLNVEKNKNFLEKDKLTLILSYIPFVGYIFGSKYDKNPEIKSILKLNILVSVLITIIFIFNYDNLASLSILFYIIFVSFVGVNLFGKEELININLPDFFEPKTQIIYLKTFFKYLKYYIFGKFKDFSIVKLEILENENKKAEIRRKKISELEETSGIKFLFYVPILNFITLFYKDDKLVFHKRNGLIISFLFIILLILIFLKVYKYTIILIFLFPICFGIGKLYKTTYTMPYIYDLYELFANIKNIFVRNRNKINEKRKEVKEINLKVGGEENEK